MSTATLSTLDASAAAPAKSGFGAVRLWLFAVAALVFAMVMVGGATRLTGSGLSITEWKPVTGVLLPMSEQSWQAEFDKYKAIPQYELMNQGMTVSDFKRIYLWEWAHRLLGRLIGLAFLLPLLVFAWRGTVRGRLLVVLLGIGALGGLQGGIGWIMVASGLKPGMTAVQPIKLMLHLVAACAIFACLVWVATGLKSNRTEPRPAGLRRGASLVLALLFMQLALGALVAGLDAGLSFNTWPLMDGRLIPAPETLWPVSPWWANMVQSVGAVQFNHRIGAYLLFAAALWHAVAAARQVPGTKLARRAVALAGLVTVQAGLGITALLLQVPLWAGLMHQAFAILVLGHAVAHRRLLAAR